MICVDHLCYHYKGGRPILRDVSFELESGRFLPCSATTASARAHCSSA